MYYKFIILYSRYDCSIVENYDKAKCYFHGKEYEVGDVVASSETVQICETDCYCTR